MADRVSARRAGANSFFFTLHAALAAFVGTSLRGAVAPLDRPYQLHAFGSGGHRAGAGLVLSLTWWQLLRYYRRLNRAKFKVIVGMEENMPERPFTKEWAELHPGESQNDAGKPDRNLVKRWWRKNRHSEASVVEQVVPLVFAAIYVVLGVRAIIQ